MLAQTLVVSELVLAILGGVADTAQVEHVACLLGSGTTVHAVYFPAVAERTPLSVRTAEDCPDGTVGEWHNHVFGVSAGKTVVPETPEEACFLGASDTYLLRRSTQVVHLVHVNLTTYCWWFKAQWDTGWINLESWEGQRSW